ncbi:hypothetical protein ASPZODRAFT_27050 [Penicilliopsis zonata CBS 506.65]|uniref:Glycosyl transferase family 1 domain-containing protein n=1 Tax=Penicilliopsis zonata CBS 506.65 TaxID=1073090 RepID=A0A1L9SCV5_9EURO|nr:hypothetical protein ASPZODRAFT_27050 [Penicilliopsis zonata CBS 506.65]OJJ45021.1 hypothetical protein ASPZODRAFT_27050 [Penicilliopsis zonata CBS 506.65]
MALFLGLTAIGWHQMIHTWWDLVLASLLLAVIAAGGIYILYVLSKRIHARLKKKPPPLPSAVARCVSRFANSASLRTYTDASFSSFGVFLGAMASPPTPAQAAILSKWDLLVVDPHQWGVLDAIADSPSSGYVIGRLDIHQLASLGTETVSILEKLTARLLSWKRPQNGQFPLNGVLLAYWEPHLPPVVLNILVAAIRQRGLAVWLELAPPDYPLSTQIDLANVRGLIYRNGTLWPHGERRDFFQMEGMRTAMRVAAKRNSKGSPLTSAVWETVDDSVPLGHHVAQRSFKWCSYNSLLCWFGRESGLNDADLALASTIQTEPLTAMMFLKDEKVMSSHTIWRENEFLIAPSEHMDPIYESLALPALNSLVLHPPTTQDTSDDIPVDSLDTDVFIKSYDSSIPACPHLGLDCTAGEIHDLQQAQSTIEDLKLSDRMSVEDIAQVAEALRPLGAYDSHVQKLINMLLAGDITVLVGLASGLRTRRNAPVWGMFQTTSDGMTMYVSAKAVDKPATILHTFLASRGYNQLDCLRAEIALADATNSLNPAWGLTTRMVADLAQLTPTEALLWLKAHRRSDDEIMKRIEARCEHQLLVVPSVTQRRVMCSTEYLSGEVSPAELIADRLAWYRELGLPCPDYDAALDLFNEVSRLYPMLLLWADSKRLDQFAAVLHTVIQPGKIDVYADLLALSVFCICRVCALDEIELEVLDRNPRPNGHSVQAACFAEAYALGAGCDTFFDTSPKALGTVLRQKYLRWYEANPVPRRDNGFTELPTTYASMEVDLDDGYALRQAWYYRVTFLGIFAVPALIDISMLTMVGRGLYLTTFMADEHKTLATTALMLALLVCGGFGSWISSGGSYYLYAMAFPTMSMFVLTRFAAGLAVVSVGAVVSLVSIAITKGIVNGLVFSLYFTMLATYLMALSTMAVYQMPGFSFQSGRSVIMTCIPILFASPVITLWVTDHDLVVYLCILYFFLFNLLLGARRVMAKWNNWYLDIPTITDKEVAEWYKSTDQNSGLTPREALLARVTDPRTLKKEKGKDALVDRLAAGYPSTVFLLTWYCNYSRTQMPLAYSPTWNLQLRAAIDTLGDMQKGLKLHSGFLHWRHTGTDVACGILYFVLALLDKWTALITGQGDLVGLSAGASTTYRLSVGFGLAYYLLGAVILDAVSQPLWTAVSQNHSRTVINSFESLREATGQHTLQRRSLYIHNVVKYFFFHLWAIAITSAMIWSFEGHRDAVILYLTYVGSYTGLLFYQFNRIFAGPEKSARALIGGALLGLVAGLALRLSMPLFAYSGVIGLASGTWTSAILSFAMSGIWKTKSKDTKDQTETLPVIHPHGYSCLEPDLELSQTTLSHTVDIIRAVPEGLRHHVRPSHEVLHLLQPKKSTTATVADVLTHTLERWQAGTTVIELVPTRHIQTELRTVSRLDEETLYIYVLADTKATGEDIHRNNQMIAEALVQATCQMVLGWSYHQSLLAESFVVPSENEIPEGVKRQLERNEEQCARLLGSRSTLLLRHALLGFEADDDWDKLPLNVRTFLLRRWYGESSSLSLDAAEWLVMRLAGKWQFEERQDDIHSLLTRCSHSLRVASRTVAHASILSDEHPFLPHAIDPLAKKSIPRRLIDRITSFRQKLRIAIKFTVLSLIADPEYQRELVYTLRNTPAIVAWPIMVFLNTLWLYTKAFQEAIFPLVLLHGREQVSSLYHKMQNWSITVERHRIVLDYLDGPMTAFLHPTENGSLLYCYEGRHDSQPTDTKQLKAINTYSTKLVLEHREEFTKSGNLEFVYEYDNKKIYPLQRRCVRGDRSGELVEYNSEGYITSGSALRDINRVAFRYRYREHPGGGLDEGDELLHAEFVLPHITIRVAWSMPPPTRPQRWEHWVPYPRVTEATFVKTDREEGQEEEVYRAYWTYDHKYHPHITTTLNGRPVKTPEMIEEDWFHVLDKPQRCSFADDHPLLPFARRRNPGKLPTSWLARAFRRHIYVRRIATAKARTVLWRAWKSSKMFDAVTARWLDERILRKEPALRPYWRRRDWGWLDGASKYLDAQVDTVMARIDIDPAVSSWTPLAFEISDLYSFGQGGDACINTRTLSTQIQDTDKQLHVLAMDTGTWPNEPGGVSACRRDLVNELQGIRWHIMAEAANDYGVPRFQIERNVQSLSVLPQWGLDFLNPTHGVFQNYLDAEVVERSHATNADDIRRCFVPILASLVRCVRTIKWTRQTIEQATTALVDLNAYFEAGRSWNDVWMSDVVRQAWRALWLEYIPGGLNVEQMGETPILGQMDSALDMWHRYLFIFSIPIPERIPDVFQASHHFTGATYGVICKVKRGCALHVWDHCISFREMTTFLSSAVSFDSVFVNSTLIPLGHLACVLLEHHADVVLPCAEYFNPGWEVELGTAEGALQHRRAFARKIDPVVNGITNMERYTPIEEIKTATPTVVMLSHIRYVKDIKTAIMATDLIVNRWGFKDYRLHIYGDMERAPAYASECQEIIASKGLREHVVLKGLGNPTVVLQDAWLFMNSSISEGLPLAMGEAALTGVPVVCTDVGASFCVVTDRTTGKRFSEVVAPNDGDSLARAQIRILALLGEWAAFSKDPAAPVPSFSLYPTEEEVQAISERMYEQVEQRRQLGMRGRANVLRNFSSHRYLREHEQMLWLGKFQSKSFVARGPASSNVSSITLNEKERLSILVQPVDDADDERKWRKWYTRSSRMTAVDGSRLTVDYTRNSRLTVDAGSARNSQMSD